MGSVWDPMGVIGVLSMRFGNCIPNFVYCGIYLNLFFLIMTSCVDKFQKESTHCSVSGKKLVSDAYIKLLTIYLIVFVCFSPNFTIEIKANSS